MWFGVISIFPELFETFREASLIGRARQQGLVEIDVFDLREYTEDRHRVVDDEPYGGGGGMVMTAPPIVRAVRATAGGARRILLSPQGRRLDDGLVQELATQERLLLVCGRYEGVDDRVRDMVIDDEISLGDYVLSGGELPAMVLIEAVSRCVPGVVGRPCSVEEDSFREGLLDHPHYTRPREFEGRAVPEVLLSGNHAEIARWRRGRSLERTKLRRPDLLGSARLSVEERREVSGGLACKVRRGAE